MFRNRGDSSYDGGGASGRRDGEGIASESRCGCRPQAMKARDLNFRVPERRRCSKRRRHELRNEENKRESGRRRRGRGFFVFVLSDSGE